MTRGPALLALLLLCAALLTSCGEDSTSEAPAPAPPAAEADADAEKTAPEADADAEKTAPEADAEEAAGDTEIIAAPSRFGRMLFDTRKQAIYIFERDSRNKTNCYGECATEWPPVLTESEPRAGSGVRASLLGTIKRRDGKQQVTYAGKPLYFYAHEEPGQVLCHNVSLNGGFWWVVGPDGERRP